MERQFKIGQVVWILSDKTQEVIPAMVIEELVVKKLDGIQTSWKFSIGPNGKNKVVNSSQIKSDIFFTLPEVEKTMQDKFAGYIKTLLVNAKTKSDHWYGKTANDKSSVATKAEKEPLQVDPADLMAEFGEEQAMPNKVPYRISNKEEISEKLRQMVMSDEPESEQEQKKEDIHTITLEDGRIARVKL